LFKYATDFCYSIFLERNKVFKMKYLYELISNSVNNQIFWFYCWWGKIGTVQNETTSVSKSFDFWRIF